MPLMQVKIQVSLLRNIEVSGGQFAVPQQHGMIKCMDRSTPWY